MDFEKECQQNREEESLTAAGQRAENACQPDFLNHRNSFPKSARIRKRPEYLCLGRLGKKAENKFFIGIYKKNQVESRIGVTVTRRVGNAVTRNRIERYVREYFRVFRKNASVKCDVNIIAKNKAAGLRGRGFSAALADIFRRIDESHFN